MVGLFDAIGLGPWLRFVTSAIEVIRCVVPHR